METKNNQTTDNNENFKTVGYVITEAEINNLLQYLSTKPYGEVYQLVNMLLIKGQPQQQ